MHPRTILSLGNFFISIAGTLVGYTLVSYLTTFLPEAYVGLVIAAGATIAIISFCFLPRLVAYYGAQRLVLYFAFIEMMLLLVVATAPHTLASVACVILVISAQPLLFYGLDLLLEATIDSENITARVHTAFLTGGNLGALAGPLLIGALLADVANYILIFLAAAAALVPFIVLFAARKLPASYLPRPSHVHDTLEHLSRDRDLAAVTFAHFVLYLFYVWAPLYIPVYLHVVVGIPWSSLGWMFSVMLLPYILLEYPAGWIADRILGDKELMVAGFLIAGSALAAVSTITPQSSFPYILSILIATRIGAALIESMTEGHFFRRVSQKDIVSVSVFRGVWPLASFIAPLLAGLMLYIGTFPFFFVLSGTFIALTGVLAALRIKDFR